MLCTLRRSRIRKLAAVISPLPRSNISHDDFSGSLGVAQVGVVSIALVVTAEECGVVGLVE